MVAKRDNAGNSEPRRRPARTPEARDQQLASYAYDLAEKQLINGTASSAVHVHFLKVAGLREKRELARLENENLLTQAKIAQAGQADRMEGLLTNAMKAFTTYQGKEEDEEEDDDY
jgi:hypothetical protein